MSDYRYNSDAATTERPLPPQDAIVASMLAATVIVPAAAGLDNQVQGIAALTFEASAILLFGATMWQARCDLSRAGVLRFLSTGANAPALLWLLQVVLSWLSSSCPAYSVQEALRQIAGILVYFTVVTRFRRQSHLLQLADMLALVGLGSSIIGFVQYSQGQDGGITGLYHDHELVGSFLVALLPIVTITALAARETNRQLFAQAAASSIALCLLLSHARSAWVAAVAGIGTLALTFLLRSSEDDRAAKPARSFTVALLLCCTAVGLGIMLLLHGGSVRNRIASFMHLKAEQGWTRRLQAWQGARTMIAHSPVVGFGIGAYPVFQNHYTHMGVDLERRGGRPSLGEQAHDLYLQTAAEVGLPGLLLFVAIPGIFIVRGIRALPYMEQGVRKYLLQGAMASIVAIGVDACASPAWQCGQVSFFYWLLLGLGVVCLVEPQDTQPEKGATERGSGLARAAVSVFCLALIAQLPGVRFAVSATFPDHVEIVPADSLDVNVNRDRSVEFHLFLVYTDGSRRDVTTDTNTRFTVDVVNKARRDLRPSSGHVIYQPAPAAPGEKDAPVITGTYEGAGPDGIRPKDSAACALHISSDEIHEQ